MKELDIIMTDTEFKLLEQHYKQKLLNNPMDKENIKNLSNLYVFRQMFWEAELLWLEYGDQLDFIPKNQIDENGKSINIAEEVFIAINENKQIINKKKIDLKQTKIKKKVKHLI